MESSRLSIKKLKKSSESRKRAKVTLCVSCSGVRFVDCRSKVSTVIPTLNFHFFFYNFVDYSIVMLIWKQRVLCEHTIENINGACQDDEDLRYVAYTTFDEPSGEHFCHVFASDDPVSTKPLNSLLLQKGQSFIPIRIKVNPSNLIQTSYTSIGN